MRNYTELKAALDAIETDGITFPELEKLSDEVSEYNRGVRAQRAALDKAGVVCIEPKEGEVAPDGVHVYPAYLQGRLVDKAALPFIDKGDLPAHYKAAMRVLAVDTGRAGWYDRLKTIQVVEGSNVREEEVENWGFMSFNILRQEAQGLERADRLRRMYGKR